MILAVLIGCLRASPNNAKAARDTARQARRPGCEELAARIRRQCRRWKRGPRPKIATVERREASVPRHGARRTPLGADLSRLTNATTEIVRLSALRPPLDRGGRDHKDTTRAQNAPRERGGLCG